MLQRSSRAGGPIGPCLPSRAKAPPSGPAWLHDIKHDGSASWRGATPRTCGFTQQHGQPGLAHFNRRPPPILAVELEQVEGAEHGVTVVTKGTDQLEHREPAVVADDRLAVDQAGARPVSLRSVLLW